MTGWEAIKWFKPEEFDSPDEPKSGCRMDLSFVLKLDKLRETYGKPITIGSGFRTAAHNIKVGGVDSSAHTEGKAADITIDASTDRFTLLHIAFNMGFKRIGIHKHFIHLDAAQNLPQNVFWLY